jgi:hypothetical protein
MNRADAKIGLLREVVERVQRGEDVDVERLLGTGDVGQEAEWEDVVKEIEEEELLYQSKKKRRAARHAASAADAATGDSATEQGKVLESTGLKDEKRDEVPKPEPVVKVAEVRGARFY